VHGASILYPETLKLKSDGLSTPDATHIEEGQ